MSETEVTTPLRPTAEMHWWLWEAILMEVDLLATLRFMPDELFAEVRAINKETKDADAFTEELKERACKAEQQITTLSKKFRIFSNQKVTG